MLNECDILLDQVYAYDQGYNALEAMALRKGCIYWSRKRMGRIL